MGSSGGTVYYSSPVQKMEVAPLHEESAPVEVTPEAAKPAEVTPTSADATLTLSVPAEAKVFVNGVATRSMGANRRYVSRGLEQGNRYTYEVRAEVVRGGQTVQETQTVQLEAGKAAALAFKLDAASNPLTSLTVNVPEDAKVYLSGSETTSKGTTRVFKTNKLESGAVWSNYTIRASVTRDGRTVDMEKQVSLNAGESKSVTFDFDLPQVAAR
jgi:uncharacterized protein (TIGR03000 family)